jgi:hypothetical protein
MGSIPGIAGAAGAGAMAGNLKGRLGGFSRCFYNFSE